MPTYRYRCGTCGDELEVWQSFSEKPLRLHEGCGGELRRVLAPAGIVLKGSGFYKTDSRRSGNGKQATAPKESSDAASGSGPKDGSSSPGSKDAGSGSREGGSGSKDAGSTPSGSSSSSSSTD